MGGRPQNDPNDSRFLGSSGQQWATAGRPYTLPDHNYSVQMIRHDNEFIGMAHLRVRPGNGQTRGSAPTDAGILQSEIEFVSSVRKRIGIMRVWQGMSLRAERSNLYSTRIVPNPRLPRPDGLAMTSPPRVTKACHCERSEAISLWALGSVKFKGILLLMSAALALDIVKQ
jgi:hypothetical protein